MCSTFGDDEGGATTAQQFQDMWRDRRDVQPVLAEALMVPAREPTDTETYRHFLLRAR